MGGEKGGRTKSRGRFLIEDPFGTREKLFAYLSREGKEEFPIRPANASA